MIHSAESPPLVYLDAAATTPVRPEVRAAMEPFLTDELFGNPSSTHRAGRAARQALEDARQRIAAALDAPGSSVVFTSGGTEADNLAVLGSAFRARERNQPVRVAIPGSEHKAVLDAAHHVEALGWDSIVLPVDTHGGVELDHVQEALDRGLSVLSVMWVNNETGAVQPIRRIAEMAVDAAVPFHTDAVQAVGKVPCSVEQSGATMLSISGHKIGAPKGCGALIMRADAAISPLLHGGGQQRGVRPGTENVASAAALATAVELAVAECDAVERSVGALRDELEHRVTTDIADIEIVASESTRAPHISNIAFGGVDAGTLLAALDLAGIACSAGSACASGSAAASHVLLAMGLPDNLIGGAVRFSFSLRNTATDVARLLNVLPDAVAKSRAARGVA